MDPSVITVSILSFLSFFLSVIFSLFKGAAASFSWTKLEIILPPSISKRRLERYRANTSHMFLTSIVGGTIANFIFIFSIHMFFVNNGTLSIQQSIYALVISLCLILIFGKAIPETIASHRPERIMLWFLPVITPIYTILIWIVYPLHLFTQFFSKKVVSELSPPTTATIEKEILSVVSEGERKGVIQESEKEMIAGIIQLRDSEVSEIMTPRTDMVSIKVDAPLDDAIKLSLENGHSRIPVHQENKDDIIGVLYIKDLLRFWNDEHRKDVRLSDVMRKPFFIPESKRIGRLLKEFQNLKLHIAIVLDEYGGTSGLVTIEDIIEEVVGEIRDEYEKEEEITLQMINENVADVDAKIRIYELNEALSIELPKGEGYETVGGFLFACMGRIPAKDEIFKYKNTEFTILDASERKIKRVKVVVDRTVSDPCGD